MDRNAKDRKATRVCQFTTVPSTVTVGVSTAYVWTVTVTGPGSGAVSQAAKFSTMPAHGVTIDTVTNAAGVPVAATSGATDAAGQITVMLTIQFAGTGSITGTDIPSSQTDTAMVNGV